METPTTHQLFDALRDSGLCTKQQLASAESIFTESPEPPALADQLWGLGVLTKYQYAKIKSGRFDDILYGPYLVLDKIGEGGMGKVFKAVELGKGRLVALKTIRPQLMSNKVVLKRYQREANATKALNHPNVVSLYDADEINGRFCMAMEFVEGIDLSRMVKEFGHPPQRGLDDYQEACEYVRQASLGLHAAHSLGFVHRDIKPSNMLVFGERALAGTNGKATVKILDMGLVRRILESEETTRSELTRDGTVVGTPDYMAPEQAKNSSTVDHKADLYSLGCTLFFMLRGQSPFPDGNPIDKLIRHQLDAPPDLRALRPDVPEGVHQIIDRLLKKKPDERYATAEDVAKALAPFTPGGSGGHAATAPATPAYAPFSLEPDPPTGPPPSVPLSDSHLSSQAVVLGPKSTPAGRPPSSGTTARPLPSGRSAPPTPRSVTASTSTPSSGTVSSPTRPTPVSSPQTARPGGVRLVPVAASGKSAEGVGPISSPSLPTTSNARTATPVSIPKPARRPQKAVRRKAAKSSNTTYLVIGGVLGVMVIAAGALVLRSGSRGDTAPPTAQDAPKEALPQTARTGYEHLSPVEQMFPPGTVAAVVAYPRPLKAENRWPAAVARGFDALARRARFDPRQFDRTTVSFTVSPDQYLATGEGAFLTPDWTTDTENRLQKYKKAGPLTGSKYFKIDDQPSPILAAVVPSRAFTVSNNYDLLRGLDNRLSNGAKGPRIAEDVSPELVRQFPAPDSPNPPMITFAATGPWSLPLPAKTSLHQKDIDLLVAEVRWNDGFQVTLKLTGKTKDALYDFVNLDLAKELAEAYPSIKPLAAKLASAKPVVQPTANGVGYELSASFNWDEVTQAVEPLIPAGN